MTPAPKPAHELITHPVLGQLAAAQNSVDVAFRMLQDEQDRRLWLKAIARDAERLASVARTLLEQG